MSRHIPAALLVGLVALLLAGCGGTEVQVTAVVSNDTYTANIAFTPGSTNDQAVTIQLRPK